MQRERAVQMEAASGPTRRKLFSGYSGVFTGLNDRLALCSSDAAGSCLTTHERFAVGDGPLMRGPELSYAICPMPVVRACMSRGQSFQYWYAWWTGTAMPSTQAACVSYAYRRPH